jgi:hypothetical protein
VSRDEDAAYTGPDVGAWSTFVSETKLLLATHYVEALALPEPAGGSVQIWRRTPGGALSGHAG